MDALIRRRMMMVEAGASPTPPTPLPYDAEIEYIKTTGTQYIDTLLTLTSDTTKISCDFQCKINTLGTPSKYYLHSYPNAGFQIYTSNSTIVNQNASRNVNTTTTYTVIANSTATTRVITVNGSTASSNFSRSVTDGSPIYILGTAYSGGVGSYANFYYFKVFRNDILIFDGIPVRVGTVGYLYDRVSGQLFGNSGTGSFILGNDKNS